MFHDGERLYVGKYPVAHVGYNPHRSKSDGPETAYKATSDMPGIKPVLGTYETIEQAKAKAESVATYWMEGLQA
jgi:hypothetical protein